MLHLFRFTCNDLCTWLPMTAPPLYYWYCTFRDWRAASTSFTKGPSDTFSSFSNHLFLHASDVCSCLRLKSGACTLLCNFHKTLPPPPHPRIVSEGANNPYAKVHSTYQFSSLLAASFIFLYQTGEKMTRLSYNHGRVYPSHLTVLVKWSLYVAKSLTAVLERLH